MNHKVTEVRPYTPLFTLICSAAGWQIGNKNAKVGQTTGQAGTGIRTFKTPEALIYWHQGD